MEFLTQWLVLAIAVLLAAMAPGPDFAMALRNALAYSRRAGIFTAFGFAGGVCVHMFYCSIGLAAVISKSILLFSLIKFIGAAYLFYIGVQALLSRGYAGDPQTAPAARGLGDFAAFRSGFITNLFNPKATLFFLALYTQIISPDTPAQVHALYAATAAAIVSGWFSLVALVLTGHRIKSVYIRFSRWIDRVCGAFMIGFGLRLALVRSI